jgi:hypothetical protein
MDHLQKWFDKTVEQLLEPNEILLTLMENQFSVWGIALSETQKSSLKVQIQKDQIETFVIDLSDNQIEQFRKAGYDPDSLVLDFRNFDKKGFEQGAGKICTDLIFKASDIASDTLLKDWKKQADTLLKRERKKQIQFTRYVDYLCGKPLKLLEMLLSICEGAGFDFDANFRSVAIKENDMVFDVLTRSHLRGCQIGREILTLLSSGLADGAYARWRTLHEVSVVVGLIAEHGKGLAERYLFHKAISDYHDAVQYQQHCAILGFEPLSDAKLEALKSKRDAVIERFGDKFDYDYGWAEGSIGLERKRNINFTDIEKAVSLQHMRPFYKAANLNVHAGSGAILFRFGAPPNQDILPTRGSVFGLSEPGRNTALSISLITGTLLLTKQNLDRLALVTAIQKMRDEVFWAFDEVDAVFENGKID